MSYKYTGNGPQLVTGKRWLSWIDSRELSGIIFQIRLCCLRYLRVKLKTDLCSQTKAAYGKFNL